MFRGLNAVNIDTKGRIAMPTRYRDALLHESEGQVVITIDTEVTCLLMYPLVEWEKIEAKLQSLPSFNPQARRIQRLLIGHATELEMDSNGRLLIPPLLREYAGLDKCIMLVGQGRKFELWDEQQWQNGRESWLSEVAGTNESLPEELLSLSL